MSLIYLVIPIALFMAAVALGAFLWSVKHGQFDDIDSASVRPLLDDVADRTGPDQRVGRAKA